MNILTLEERKNWWLKAYTFISFEQALISCNQLLKYVDSNSHDLYLPLSIAIHVLYGRPFAYQNGVGKLENNFIPDNYKSIHNCLITFRDKVFAHSDADATKELGQPFLDVVYHIKRDYNFFSTSDPCPDLNYYQNVSEYLPIVIKKVKNEIDQNKEKLDALSPNLEGDYLFNLNGDQLFTIYKPPPSTIKF